MRDTTHLSLGNYRSYTCESKPVEKLREQLSSIMSKPTGPDSHWVTMYRLTEESSLLYRQHDTLMRGSPTLMCRANTEIQILMTTTRLMAHFNRKKDKRG